ncbi:MAG: carboxypeptidase-like regulatory domain-containing protein, partial [Bacteroidaceae bacterium]|nr:carboxypeptidase-like regulatory domain-containing protein [Bacteroidaceae bacterium]
MKRLILSLTLMVTMAVAAFAQDDVITGSVCDEQGEALIGATVMVKGTKQGVVTDINGNFKIADAAGKSLVFSYIGYESVTVKAKKGMKVKMKENAQLDEVVVTGTQVIDKRLFTGAATKIEAEKTKLDGVADVSRALEGRVAGVTVQNVSGTFGTAPKIRVRGATSIYGNSKPLWVIDGVILEDDVDINADDLSSGDAETLISNAIA